MRNDDITTEIIEELFANNPNRTRLVVTGDFDTKIIQNQLVSALEKNTYLTELDLSGLKKPVSEQFLKGLASFLKGNNTLKKLNLDCIVLDFNRGFIGDLFNILSKNSSLIYLSIAGNQVFALLHGINESNVKALSCMLNNNTSLKYLNLSGHKFGYRFLEILNTHLIKNSTLNGLNLNGNNLWHTDEVAKLIRKTELLSLDLSDNLLTVVGVNDLVESVQENSKLITLNLQESGIQKYVKKHKIDSTLKVNRALRYFFCFLPFMFTRDEGSPFSELPLEIIKLISWVIIELYRTDNIQYQELDPRLMMTLFKNPSEKARKQLIEDVAKNKQLSSLLKPLNLTICANVCVDITYSAFYPIKTIKEENDEILLTVEYSVIKNQNTFTDLIAECNGLIGVAGKDGFCKIGISTHGDIRTFFKSIEVSENFLESFFEACGRYIPVKKAILSELKENSADDVKEDSDPCCLM